MTPTTRRSLTLDASQRARASMECGLRHVRAEQTNDLAEIMATVSGDPYFPMIDHDGRGGTTLQLLIDTPSVTAYYADRHGSYEIVASKQIAAVTTDFYTFRESVATLRPVGEVGGEQTDGRDFQVNSAVLFPTTADGIGGELVWTRYPFGDVVTGRVQPPAAVEGPAHLPNARMHVADAHDAYLDAWRRGDTDGMLAQVAPDCRWQRRVRHGDGTAIVSASGPTETRQAFEAAVAPEPPPVIEVLNRVVTEWYVFADLYLELSRNAGVAAARHIALHPIDGEGRLRGEMGVLDVLTEGSAS